MIAAVVIMTFLIAVFAIITVFVAHRVNSIQDVVDSISLVNTDKVQELDNVVSSAKSDTGSLTSRLNVIEKELSQTGQNINNQQRQLQNEVLNRVKLDKRINHYGAVMNVMDEQRQQSFDSLDDKLIATDSKFSKMLATTNDVLNTHKAYTYSTFSNIDDSMGTLCNLMFDNMQNMDSRFANRMTGFSNYVTQEFMNIDTIFGALIDLSVDYTLYNESRVNNLDRAIVGTSNQVLNNYKEIARLKTTTDYLSTSTNANFNKVYNNLSDLTESNNNMYNIMKIAQDQIKLMQRPIINSTTVVQEVPTVFDKLNANRVVIGPDNYGMDVYMDAQTNLSVNMKLHAPLGITNKQNQPIMNMDPTNMVLSASNIKASCIYPFSGTGKQSMCFAPASSEVVIKGGPLRIDTDLITSVPSKGIHMNNLTTSNLSTRDLVITGVMHNGNNATNSYINTPGRMDGEIMLARDKFCIGDVVQSSCIDKNTLIKLLGMAATGTATATATTTTTTTATAPTEFISLYPETLYRGSETKIAKETKTYRAADIGWANRNIKSIKLPTSIRVQFYVNGSVVASFLGKYDFQDVNISFTDMFVEVIKM